MPPVVRNNVLVQPLFGNRPKSYMCVKIIMLDLFGKPELEVISRQPPLRLTEYSDGGKSYTEGEASGQLAPIFAAAKEAEAKNTNDGTFPTITVSYHTSSITFADASGIIYKADNKINYSSIAHGSEFIQGFCLYKIFFDDCCGEFEFTFRSEHFPGWECRPIASMSGYLKRTNEALVR